MMASHRIMLLGAAGQIGQALQRQPLPPSWRLGLYGRAELDITHPAAVREAVQSFRPGLIINAAGLTNIENAERDLDAALIVNFEATAILAAQASTHDVPLIHLSTDEVFDGLKTTPYMPDDPMNPLNAYGKSKMMSEEAVRHELPWHVILRLSWVFSSFGDNILTRLLREAGKQEELPVPTDRMATPTPAEAVASALIVIAAALLDGKGNGFGTFHFCGAPPCMLYDFALAVMDVYASRSGKRQMVKPVIDADFASLAAPQPRYSVLDCAKIHNVYGIDQPLWRDSLAGAVEAFISRGNAHP